jgi:hypothetical protein
MEWHVRRATIDDIKHMAPRLRQDDVDEIRASTGMTPEECLLESLDTDSIGTWVGVFKGQPEIIFGCATTPDPSIGVPWMLGTDALKDSPREFIQKCKLWVKGFSKQFPVLKNFVYAKNELHIRWLKWCGFEFIQLHEKHGFAQEPFWEFEMRQKEIKHV